MTSMRGPSRIGRLILALAEALANIDVPDEFRVTVQRVAGECLQPDPDRSRLAAALDALIDLLERGTDEYASSALLQILLVELGRARLGLWYRDWGASRGFALCRAYAVAEAATSFPRHPELWVAAWDLIIELERADPDDLADFEVDLVVDELMTVWSATDSPIIGVLLESFGVALPQKPAAG